MDPLRFLNEIGALRLGRENCVDTASDATTFLEPMTNSPNIQCTSADGFFNRKRGRPPKNRFVQVYKNLQPDRTPQAVFTSFKLEKQGTLPTNATEFSAVGKQMDFEGNQKTEHRKFQLRDIVTSEKESCVLDACTLFERKSPLFDYERNNLAPEQKLVRSTGTFFPTQNTDNKYLNATCLSEAALNENQINETEQELPEDLSIRKKTKEQIPAEPLSSQSLTSSYLQMFHLLNLYRQTQQLPHLLHIRNYGLGREASATTASPTKALATLEAPTADSILRLSSHEKHMPFGYSRYRFSEDCGLPRCGYRMRQTHFHCDRNDCKYSFCDRARFLQHTARHKRLDELLASDFKHFRPNVECHYASCAQTFNSSRKSSSHFHCLKCSFVCYETNKFSSHRRLHNKLSCFKKAGFRKVLSRETCDFSCPYNKNQTHYHCSICDFSVCSKSQFMGHKH